jgi:hypothetical protein
MSCADDLATWTMARLVNRLDAWGAYRPIIDRGKAFTRQDGIKGKLGNSTTSKGTLTVQILARHFRGEAPEHIVGLHSTSPGNTSIAGALDIDLHEASTVKAEVTEAAALAWYRRLQAIGFHPLLTSSNGRGGFHLRILFAEPVPTPRVFGFLQWLAADYAAHGLAAPPETFPKQASLAPGQYGNWLRLPGRHHTRDYWSCVWDGERWLEDGLAGGFILGLRGNCPLLIPSCMTDAESRQTLAARTTTPVPPTTDAMSRRVLAYLARLPNRSAGEHRDDIAYQFAAFLARDLCIPDVEALGWLERWDAGNTPPKGTDRLCEIIASAHAYGQHAYGHGLAPRALRPSRHRPDKIRFTVEI